MSSSLTIPVVMPYAAELVFLPARSRALAVTSPEHGSGLPKTGTNDDDPPRGTPV